MTLIWLLRGQWLAWSSCVTQALHWLCLGHPSSVVSTAHAYVFCPSLLYLVQVRPFLPSAPFINDRMLFLSGHQVYPSVSLKLKQQQNPPTKPNKLLASSQFPKTWWRNIPESPLYQNLPELVLLLVWCYSLDSLWEEFKGEWSPDFLRLLSSYILPLPSQKLFLMAAHNNCSYCLMYVTFDFYSINAERGALELMLKAGKWEQGLEPGPFCSFSVSSHCRTLLSRAQSQATLNPWYDD